MRRLEELFERNRAWAARTKERDPEFFTKLAHQQSPHILWIGCADSRVPATEITGMLPGEMFVHRNVANVVVHSDLNCLSVLQFAVEVLGVDHIIVCGHYGCGGVQAVVDKKRFGLIDNWLRHVEDVAKKHASELDPIRDPSDKGRRLCELNVIEQVVSVCDTTIVRGAWERGQRLTVHGWIYHVSDGLLRDLGLSIESEAEIPAIHQSAVERSRPG